MNLTRVDSVVAPDDDSLILYCPVRDERALVSLFLEYHRKLGIKYFVFVDSGSVDGTLEYLLSQADCIIYATEDSYAEAKYAADWISELMRRHSFGQWALYLDCDELLVYENCETIGVEEFLKSYRLGDYNSFYGIMLDVYSAEPYGEVEFSDYQDFVEKDFYVDSDYVVRRKPRKPWKPKQKSKPIEIVGGPRCRIYSNLDSDSKRGWLRYFIAGQVDHFINYVPMSCMNLLARIWPRPSFAQYKSPLNLVGSDFGYRNSHGSSNRKFTPYLIGILHLKFSKELKQKLDPVFSHKNHYHRGLERFRLDGAIKRKRNPSFMTPCSVKYEGSKTLSKYSIIGESPSAVWQGECCYYRTLDSESSY